MTPSASVVFLGGGGGGASGIFFGGEGFLFFFERAAGQAGGQAGGQAKGQAGGQSGGQAGGAADGLRQRLRFSYNSHLKTRVLKSNPRCVGPTPQWPTFLKNTKLRVPPPHPSMVFPGEI